MILINDTRLRWLGPPALFVFGNVFFRLSFWLQAAPPDLITAILIGLVAGYLFWHLGRWVTQREQQRFPGLEQT